MISSKIVNRVEDHWEAVSDRLLRRIRASALVHVRQLAESEVREAARRILSNLGHYLAAAPENELAGRYREIGRQRCRDGFPLAEAVRVLQMLREVTEDYAREQGFTESSMEIYAEEEFEHLLNRFFDLLLYHLVDGYERELRATSPAAATAAGRR